ncbi:MAG: HAMP domain-containing sensor histidine kinase, partial [Leptolyngbyaceae cyanobacterium bins.59]|nr:HAMP domain-containing sensor histidine kinase [Leptolyngbyaceae cyanobacterium bins.59]
LRTPLNAMLGWAQTLQTRDFNETTRRRGLETIERNARLQAQLIDDILDFSRIIRGQLRLHLQSVHLMQVVEAAISSVRPAAEAKHIKLLTLFTAQDPQILGDPNRLQQILWNLLSNAVKFTPESGNVTIHLEEADSRVQIRVVDTGIGISPDFLPYVFEHFRQADSSTTRSHGGLGLGLAIVRQLVELQGGTVYAESLGEGLGATFTIIFPLLTGNPLPLDVPLVRSDTSSLSG